MATEVRRLIQDGGRSLTAKEVLKAKLEWCEASLRGQIELAQECLKLVQSGSVWFSAQD
jgi:hypothetical protein